MFYLPSNQKKLLSNLNPLFVVSAVLGIFLFRTGLMAVAPSFFKQWDVLLPFVVYFGQRRSIFEGLVLALFTGHLFSLCSGAPIGVFTSSYLILFVVARLITYGLYANTGGSVFLLLLGLSVAERLLLTVVGSAFGVGWSIWYSGVFSFWTWIGNAALGWLIYVGLEVLDQLTFKAEPTNIELGGDLSGDAR